MFSTIFSTSKTAGNSDIENFRQPSATVTSTSQSGILSPAPAIQIPSASPSGLSLSGFPVGPFETFNSGNQVTNLVKPSSFFASASSSSQISAPISSSSSPSTALQHSLNMPHQYVRTMPQPFPHLIFLRLFPLVLASLLIKLPSAGTKSVMHSYLWFRMINSLTWCSKHF